jgi:hypothetical protein
VYLSIAIYGGFEKIQLSGTTLYNGNATSLQPGVPVALSYIQWTSGFAFGYWESDVGSFSNYTASSTTFTPESVAGSGTLSVILNATSLSGRASAGYVVDDGNSGITGAGGTFYNVPSTTYVGSGSSVTDINSM